MNTLPPLIFTELPAEEGLPYFPPCELPDTCCPECAHDCYGESPTRYCLECDWREEGV